MALNDLIHKKRDLAVANAKVANFANPGKQARDALTPEAESAIRAWLDFIKETDLAIVEETVGRCRDNLEVRAYFLGRSKEVPQPVRDANDD